MYIVTATAPAKMNSQWTFPKNYFPRVFRYLKYAQYTANIAKQCGGTNIEIKVQKRLTLR